MVDWFRIFEYRGELKDYQTESSNTLVKSSSVPDDPHVFWLAEHIVGRTTAAAGACTLTLGHPEEQDVLLRYEGNVQYLNLNRPVLMNPKSYVSFDRLASGVMLLSVYGKKLYLKTPKDMRRGFWRFL